MNLRINDRIRLVPVSPVYREEIFRNFNERIITFLLVAETPADIRETDDFIAHSLQQIEKGHELVWVILDNDEFCGCCGIHGIKTKKPHFGIWLRESKQRLGIGSAVTKFVLFWAVQNLDIEYIRYPVDERNHASIQLIEKITPTIYSSYQMGESKILQVREYRVYPES